MTITEHRLQIERIILRGHSGPEATFLVGEWFCCQAWFKDGVPLIHSRGTVMTVEQASTVSIALQMACEWVAEEMAK